MEYPEKLVTHGTQDKDKQNKNTLCVGHHYAQTNTNNINKTCSEYRKKVWHDFIIKAQVKHQFKHKAI
jgi:hypothetical protein